MQDLSNKNIIHIKEENIEYIQFKKLLEYKEVKHAITLKPYDFCGISNYEENKDMVNENYKNLCMSIGLNEDKIIRAKQTHTNNVKTVSQNDIGIFPKSLNDVDGLITNEKGLVLSLIFADCIPLIFYDPVKNVISNIHSGWKGTVQRIGEKGAKEMIQSYASNPKDIICCIGPSIGKCHFEVEEEVFNIFKQEFQDIDFMKYIVQNNRKYYIDTVGINRAILEKLGLLPENIIESEICTVCNSSYTHSFRADKEKSGRMTAVIGLK